MNIASCWIPNPSFVAEHMNWRPSMNSFSQKHFQVWNYTDINLSEEQKQGLKLSCSKMKRKKIKKKNLEKLLRNTTRMIKAWRSCHRRTQRGMLQPVGDFSLLSYPEVTWGLGTACPSQHKDWETPGKAEQEPGSESSSGTRVHRQGSSPWRALGG